MGKILYFDISAVLISSVFLTTTIIRSGFKGTKRNFLISWIEVVVLVASIGDLGAAITEQYLLFSPYSWMMSYCFNFIYFLAHNLLLPLYVLYIYSTTGIWHIFKKYNYLVYAWILLTGLDVFLLFANIFVPLIYTLDQNGVYARGPFHLLFYVIAGIFGIWGIITILKHRRLINHDKMLVLLMIYPVTVTTIVIQYFYPDTLCEMFGISICMVLFIIVVQHKEVSVDPLVGAKRHSSGIESLTNIIETGKPATIIFVKIANNGNILMYLGQDIYYQFLHLLSQNFTKFAEEEEFPGELYYLEYGLFGFLAEEDSLTTAYRTAERIKKFLHSQIHIDNFDITLDGRICIVECPDDFNDFQSLFSFATSFHNTIPVSKNIILYSDFKGQQEFQIRDDLERILRDAIREQRFEMYYQPIFSAVKNRFVCAEALIRLHDEKYGDIPPSLFIPFAENNGMIHAIGDFVLRDVLKFISSTDIKRLGLEYIEINLSAAQCIESDLIEKVTQLLEDYHVDPENISFELTETAADMDPAIVDNHVKRLSSLGIRFALDDYGTGYSNIKRVTSLPINQVKLDQSFVKEIDNPQMWIVIQDTITMLKEMDKEVLIEGVENELLARRFIDLNADLLQGCEYMQGFYFCRPVPKDQFIAFMEEHVNKQIVIN